MTLRSLLHALLPLRIRYLDEVVLPACQAKRAAGEDRGSDSESLASTFAPSFLAATTRLHNAIYFLSGALGMAAQSDIAALCEAIWQAGLPGCEEVVLALIPYVG